MIERAPEFVEIGAGIQLAPNASWALDQLGVLEAMQRYAVFPQRLVWMDARRGEQLTSLDLGTPFLERYGYPYFVMHRSDLLDVAAASVPGRAPHNARTEPRRDRGSRTARPRRSSPARAARATRPTS